MTFTARCGIRLGKLLLVIADDTLRAFSLARTPLSDPGDAFEARCLIDSLSLTTEALRFQNLIYGAESERLWKTTASISRQKNASTRFSSTI